MSKEILEKLRTMSQIEFIKLIKNIDNENKIKEIVKMRSEGIELTRDLQFEEEDIEKRKDTDIQ